MRTSLSIGTLSQNNKVDIRDLITDALGINILAPNESVDGFSSESHKNAWEFDANEAQMTIKRATTLLDDCNILLYPNRNIIPTTYYKVKKKIYALNLGYVKIDDCQNDCMLYWGDVSRKDCCDVCKISRWQSSKELDPDKLVDGTHRCPKPTKLVLTMLG
ncbi:hypothetical protein J1N35_022102 [Gossypium stocksii]|uniref:Uncharacterized protein n=1 Tax=Gossypium stocksii TaxID=47602 RepID=A0A9D4A0T9_9ROSI|nr:hypothetical protein J1N35_022102 [Gossypium stocksii]